jgi:hypothetical protein
MWFVDGLAGDHVGMIIKVHHALGDGIANVDLALALVDLEPDPPPDEPSEWVPRSGPEPERPARSMPCVSRSAARRVAKALSTRCATRADDRRVANVGRTVASFQAKPPPAPWNVPVSSHRRWVSASVPMRACARSASATT